MSEEKSLERRIAYAGARSDIEIFCKEGRYDNGLWINIDSCEHESTQIVGDSVNYLTQISRIVFHPKENNLVRVLNDE